jgi:hypothetical protein
MISSIASSKRGESIRVNMPNDLIAFHQLNLGHAEYARESARAEADLCRVRGDFRGRRENVWMAWMMRAAVRNTRDRIRAAREQGMSTQGDRE